MKDNKKKILFFGELPPFTIHGVSISNEINLKMLEEEYDVTVVCEIYSLKNHNSGYLTKFFLFIKSYLIFIKKNFQNKYNFFYGVIYLSTLGILKNISVILLFKLFNIKSKIILHFHRSDYNIFIKKKVNKILFDFLNIFIDKYILLSKSQINDFDNKIKNKVAVLNNTINVEFDFPIKSLNYKSNKNFKLIYVGNYIKEKGIIELINAVISLNNKFAFKIELEMYGVFASNNLKYIVDSLTNNVDFININGPIYDYEKFLKIHESDLLVLPSYNEGLPLVLLESMSVGTPVIISNVGYINDVLGENYPLYCQPKSVSSIIDIINTYIEFQQKINFSELISENYKQYSRENHRIKLLKIFSFEN